jgi:hypothetical protein
VDGGVGLLRWFEDGELSSVGGASLRGSRYACS